jgi:hypothetical protein
MKANRQTRKSPAHSCHKAVCSSKREKGTDLFFGQLPADPSESIRWKLAAQRSKNKPGNHLAGLPTAQRSPNPAKKKFKSILVSEFFCQYPEPSHYSIDFRLVMRRGREKCQDHVSVFIKLALHVDQSGIQMRPLYVALSVGLPIGGPERLGW